MYLWLFNRGEKPWRREGSWQVQAVITDQRPSRVITDRETVDQLELRTPQSVVMRPHTHDGPIGCCAVKPSLSSFTYSWGSRWRGGSGVGGARYSRPFCCFLPPAVWETQGSGPTWPAKSSSASPASPLHHHQRLLYRGAGKVANALQHMSPSVSESARKWSCSDLAYIRHMATGVDKDFVLFCIPC